MLIDTLMKFVFSSIFENTNTCGADLSRQICIYEDYNGCIDASTYLSKKIL